MNDQIKKDDYQMEMDIPDFGPIPLPTQREIDEFRDRIIERFNQEMDKAEALEAERLNGSVFDEGPFTYGEWRKEAAKNKAIAPSINLPRHVLDQLQKSLPVSKTKTAKVQFKGGMGGSGIFTVPKDYADLVNDRLRDAYIGDYTHESRLDTKGGQQHQTQCVHEAIDVGFVRSKLVCRKCDKELDSDNA